MAEQRIYGNPITLPDLDGGPPAGDELTYQDSDGQLHRSGIAPASVVNYWDRTGTELSPDTAGDNVKVAVTGLGDVAIHGTSNQGSGIGVEAENTSSGTALLVSGKALFGGSIWLKKTGHGNSDYTVLVSDCVIYLNANLTVTRTWTLPDATTRGGQVFIIKANGSLTPTVKLTIATAGGNIDGAATYDMVSPYESITVFSDGTDYGII